MLTHYEDFLGKLAENMQARCANSFQRDLFSVSLRGKGIESPFSLSVLSFGAFLFTQKKSGIGRHYNLRQVLPKRKCSYKSSKKTTNLSYLNNNIKHNSCLQGTPDVGSLR